LDLAIIRKVSPMRQGCGLMTDAAALPAAEQLKRSAINPKLRQIRLEKRGGQLFDVQ
jgi:hypothetical protein